MAAGLLRARERAVRQKGRGEGEGETREWPVPEQIERGRESSGWRRWDWDRVWEERVGREARDEITREGVLDWAVGRA